MAAVMTVASVAGGLLAQHTAPRFGTRAVAVPGAALLAVLFAAPPDTPGPFAARLAVAQTAFGLGLGGVFVCAQPH